MKIKTIQEYHQYIINKLVKHNEKALAYLSAHSKSDQLEIDNITNILVHSCIYGGEIIVIPTLFSYCYNVPLPMMYSHYDELYIPESITSGFLLSEEIKWINTYQRYINNRKDYELGIVYEPIHSNWGIYLLNSTTDQYTAFAVNQFKSERQWTETFPELKVKNF